MFCYGCASSSGLNRVDELSDSSARQSDGCAATLIFCSDCAYSSGLDTDGVLSDSSAMQGVTLLEIPIAPEAARLPLALAGPMSRLIFHYAEHWVCPEALKFVPGFAHSSGMDKADILSDSSLKQGAVCPETLTISAGYAPYSGLSRAYIWSGS